MSKPMPKITGLIAKAEPEAVEAAKKLPKLSGAIEGLVLRTEDSGNNGGGHPDQVHHSSMLPIDKIIDSPYQNRKIDEIHASDLAEIIQSDGLNQPITVRPIEDGRYEVIAGHHRLAAYKLLDKEHIPAVIKEVSDIGAARSLIFDNIHHKTYTDYEIFKGFKTLKLLDKSTSVRTLAKDTGWSKSQVQRVMSFEKLPDEAIRLLEENQDLIGANTAEDLASLCDDGHQEYVVEAIEHIKDGHLTQARAISWIKNRITPKSRAVTREILKDGKTYCSVKLERNILKINVAKNIDPQKIEEAICQFLAKAATENQDEAET